MSTRSFQRSAAGDSRPLEERRRLQVAALRARLAQDALFQVTTVDGLHWIDPHTGTLVSCSFDQQEVALRWLLSNRPWRTHKLMPFDEVRYIRWRQYLATHIEDDQHLRIFSADGTWLNPWTGTWEEQVRMGNDRRIIGPLVSAMARRLVAYDERNLGEMLPMAQLQHLVQQRAQYGSQLRTALPDELSLSARHPAISSASAPENDRPSYDLGADLDSPDLDFLQNMDLQGGIFAENSSPAPTPVAKSQESASRPAVAPVAKAQAPSGAKPPVAQVRSAPPPPPPPPSPLVQASTGVRRAERLLGGFRILTKIADGGLGGIYRAERVADGTPVALNVLLAEVSNDNAFAAAFINQGQRTQTLVHPHVIRCLGVGRDQGRLFMALELIESGDCAKQLRSRGSLQLPWQEALSYARDACRGLAAVHANGFMHGNVRPSTIYPLENQRAKLGHPQLPCCHDHPALMNVNPLFQSPEQIQGYAMDIRTDIYCLGASLFTLIAGEAPYHDLDPGRLQTRILGDPVPEILVRARAVPRQLSDILRCCLQKDPASRFSHPSELLNALEHVR